MDEFSRSRLLIGDDALRILNKSHVAVFGIGGVGSYAAEGLVRSGVGNITLVDHDTVSKSNINRQLYALNSTIGRKKVEVARERILDINQNCNVTLFDEFYLPENDNFVWEKYDYVVDAIDTITSKIDLAVKSKIHNVPIISSMGAGNKLKPDMFEVDDIFNTSVCPLCRVMRRELRRRGIDSLKTVYSKEKPIIPQYGSDKELEKQRPPGSVSFVPPVVGLIMAGEVIMDLISNSKENE